MSFKKSFNHKRFILTSYYQKNSYMIWLNLKLMQMESKNDVKYCQI